MSGHFYIAFALAVAAGIIGGAAVPWRRFELTRSTPAVLRGLVLGSIAAGLFVIISGVAGIFYFLGGPTSPYAVLAMTVLGTGVVAAALAEQRR